VAALWLLLLLLSRDAPEAAHPSVLADVPA
jgi:hypothetical protein